MRREANTREVAAPSVCETQQHENEKAETRINNECRVLKGKCQYHECEARIVSNTKKVWAWLANKKMYGWKYRKVKTIVCEGLSLGQPERRKPGFGGSMADQSGQISDSSSRGKMYATQETETNLSDSDVNGVSIIK